MKRIRFFCAILTCVALLGGFSAKAVEGDAPTFVVSEITAEAGETVEVVIGIENNPGIASAKLIVHFDEGLILNSVTNNADMEGMFMYTEEMTSPLTLNWLNFEEDYAEDGVFTTLSFTVAEDATEDKYAIDVSYEEDNVYNIREENISFEVRNGGVFVEAVAQSPDEKPQEPSDKSDGEMTGHTPITPGDEVPEDTPVAPDEVVPPDTTGENNDVVSGDSKGEDGILSGSTDNAFDSVGIDASVSEEDAKELWPIFLLVVCVVVVCALVAVMVKIKRKVK